MGDASRSDLLKRIEQKCKKIQLPFLVEKVLVNDKKNLIKTAHRAFKKPSEKLLSAIASYKNRLETFRQEGPAIDCAVDVYCIPCGRVYTGATYRICPDCESLLEKYYPNLFIR